MNRTMTRTVPINNNQIGIRSKKWATSMGFSWGNQLAGSKASIIDLL